MAFVPVGTSIAATDAISEPFVALRGADRIGNATPIDEPVAPPPAPTLPASPAGPEVSKEMQAVLDLVNDERAARGLGALRFSGNLNEAALEHTVDQAAAGDIYHVDPSNGVDPGDRIARTGYQFSVWGENVAAGYPSAYSVMVDWMNSPGHCRNILNPAFTEIGIGYVTGGARYNQFWTQVFGRSHAEPRPPGVYNPAWC
ncbi:MAG: CAP domain-containing protein [Ilumatobacter sp.]